MKEATGEANMTIITVVLIAIVAGVGAWLIPNILKSTQQKSCCTSEGGTWKNGQCTGADGSTIDVSGCATNSKSE